MTQINGLNYRVEPLQALLLCTLSDEQLPGTKVKRKVLPVSQAHGDGREIIHDVLPLEEYDEKVPGVSIKFIFKLSNKFSISIRHLAQNVCNISDQPP